MAASLLVLGVAAVEVGGVSSRLRIRLRIGESESFEADLPTSGINFLWMVQVQQHQQYLN
jgi:hypothetical protein